MPDTTPPMACCCCCCCSALSFVAVTIAFAMTSAASAVFWVGAELGASWGGTKVVGAPIDVVFGLAVAVRVCAQAAPFLTPREEGAFAL